MNARFVTEDGVVVPAVTAERMREIDRIAIDATQVARQRPDVIVDALIGYGLREAERL